MLDAVRLSPQAFTRQRTLTFPTLITAMLSGFKASVQAELDAFFAHRANRADLRREVSAQAFSKARRNISPSVFSRLNARLLSLVANAGPAPRWRGWRVVAADASKLRLFMQADGRRAVRDVTAFALYLPGVEMTLSAELYTDTVGERQMLFEHLHQLNSDDLLVLDRGYPARWLIAHLSQQKRAFCVRVDASGFAVVKTFLRSGQADAVVTIPAPDAAEASDYDCARTPTTVRLVRVLTPNGRVHVLMTSLLDAQAYPASDFAALYHSRWRIEEAFKRLKHRLALENTSGLSWRAVQQDFGAKILADNLHALTVREAAERDPLPENRKINRTYAIAHLRRRLPCWLLLGIPQGPSLQTLLSTLRRHLVPFKPGASKPRPERPKPHRSHAYKSTG